MIVFNCYKIIIDHYRDKWGGVEKRRKAFLLILVSLKKYDKRKGADEWRRKFLTYFSLFC